VTLLARLEIVFMRRKDIKPAVRTQLKKLRKQLPNWKRLSGKTKKELVGNVPAEVISEYNSVAFGWEIASFNK